MRSVITLHHIDSLIKSTTLFHEIQFKIRIITLYYEIYVTVTYKYTRHITETSPYKSNPRFAPNI